MISNIYNKFRRITTNQLYFPEIDGIRFLAITLVILFHTHGYFSAKSGSLYAGDASSWHLLNTFLINGDRGVELFFVLSGFVLCLPFAHYYINGGKKISLKKYYLRRLTRLEPPYLIAMTAIFLMQLAMHITPAATLLPSWLASLVYLHSVIYHHTPLLTVVAWSLEIEIQFYLLAPLFFRLLALSPLVRRLVLPVAAITLIILQHLYPPSFLNIYGFGQYFLTGILLADLYVSNTASNLLTKKWMTIPAMLLLPAIIFLPLKGENVTALTLLCARLVLPFVICAFYYLVLKNNIIKKVFSYKFVPIIGGMCYSIYLLHYTIISLFGRFTMSVRVSSTYLPNLLLQIALLTIPVLVISAIFYYYIERPFMSSKWLDMLLKKDKKNEA